MADVGMRTSSMLTIMLGIMIMVQIIILIIVVMVGRIRMIVPIMARMTKTLMITTVLCR
jgi:hypothetical protein